MITEEEKKEEGEQSDLLKRIHIMFSDVRDTVIISQTVFDKGRMVSTIQVYVPLDALFYAVNQKRLRNVIVDEDMKTKRFTISSEI
jgi:hypothetical protein